MVALVVMVVMVEGMMARDSVAPFSKDFFSPLRMCSCLDLWCLHIEYFLPYFVQLAFISSYPEKLFLPHFVKSISIFAHLFSRRFL